MEINKQRKILLLAALTLAVTIGVTGGSFLLENMGGKTSKAQQIMADESSIEKIYWEFGDGEKVEGRIAKHTFEEGTHNLTATVIRKNGEKEVHKGKIKVRQ